MKKTKIVKTRMAGPDHAVIQLSTKGAGAYAYRRTPCEGCPWKKSNRGLFPAEAFKHSAPTAYDTAFNVFACHESGQTNPATCAGFLLKNSRHNIAVRMHEGDKSIDMRQVKANRKRLYSSYREMAVANGVAPDDPALQPCRADFE